MALDTQPTLVGARFRIRPLAASDRDDLHTAASDPLIWEQHPDKKRYQRDIFDAYFTALLAAGGAVVFEARDDGRIIGCSRYYLAPNAPEEWSIGFTFIERRYWGGGANFALKTLMLDHLFMTEDRVWFHIGRENIRSQRGTAKLGAVLAGDCEADLLGTGNWSFYLAYGLRKDVWAGVRRTRDRSHDTTKTSG